MKATYEKLLSLISPKLDTNKKEAIAEKLEKASALSHEKFEGVYLEELVTHGLSRPFDNKVSLDDIIHSLRVLIIDNQINVSNLMEDDVDENVITDDILRQAGAIFKKQGWLICEFNEDPKLYHLAVVPVSSKAEIISLTNSLGLYVQYFD